MKKNIRLIDLAFPIVVERLLAQAMGIVNIYLFSSYDQDAVAAIGVTNQLVNFIRMMFIFVTLGTAVIVSQNIGAGNEERAESASGVAVALNVSLGLVFGLLVTLFHRPILSLLGLDGQVYTYAAKYFSIIGGLCILDGLNYTLATIMRNYGHARQPMLVFLGINVINLIGNTAIILRPFGLPDFGIGGIALWTAFSQAIGVGLMALSAVRCKIHFHIARPFPFAMARKILAIGIPGAGDNFVYSVAHICIIYFVTALGTTELTSFTYAANLIAFVQILGFSVGQANQILVGRLVGARQYDAAYQRAFRSTWLAMALNVSVMAILYIFQRPILHLFTSSEEILQIIFWCFTVDLLLEFGRPFNLVIGLSVRAAGDVKWAIAASAFSILLVLIPLAWLFTAIIPLGVPGVFLALCADEWFRGQLMTWRWRSRKWRMTAQVIGV